MLVTNKYFVYKNTAPNEIGVRLEEETFFLLRDQDAVSVMTLRSYVSNVLQILDWGLDPTTGEPLTDEQREQLSMRADGVHALAEKWSMQPHKIPD
jgi:hypothetical protein